MCLLLLGCGAGAEESERGSIAVEEGGASDGSDLTVAEEAADGYVAEMFVEDVAIEVGDAVEVFAAPEAGKEQGAGGRRV